MNKQSLKNRKKSQDFENILTYSLVLVEVYVSGFYNVL